jgi:carboxymethylenebutenolidase
MNGQEVAFNPNGKPAEGYLSFPKEANAPGVIVLHAWWGLNSFFKGLCDKLASEGFVAFAPDLNDGKVAQTVEEARQIMSEADFERRHAIVGAALEFLRARPEVRKESFALIGFSMGASWSLALAGERPDAVRKVVIFYGTEGTDFTRIKAEVLGHFSDADEWEPMDGVLAMESDMRTAGIDPVFYTYPGTGHWFFEEDREEYDLAAAEQAWARTLEFLRR